LPSKALHPLQSKLHLKSIFQITVFTGKLKILSI